MKHRIGKALLGLVAGAVAGGGLFVAADFPSTGLSAEAVKYRWVEAAGGAGAGLILAALLGGASYPAVAVATVLGGMGGGALAHEIRLAGLVG